METWYPIPPTSITTESTNSAAIVPYAKTKSPHSPPFPGNRMSGVANSSRQGIGSMIGRRDFFQAQHLLNHILDLPLIGRPRPYNSQLDLAGRNTRQAPWMPDRKRLKQHHEPDPWQKHFGHSSQTTPFQQQRILACNVKPLRKSAYKISPNAHARASWIGLPRSRTLHRKAMLLFDATTPQPV